jgi:hypothetical protein
VTGDLAVPRPPILLLPLLGGLLGCDGPTVAVKTDPAAEVRVVRQEGETTATTIRRSGAADTDLPAATPIYPGAAIKTDIASSSKEEGGSGRVIVMTTSDSLEKVAAFYDARAKEAGVTAGMIVTDTDSALRIYGDEKSDTGSMVGISRDPGKSLTEIVITAGKGPNVVVARIKDGLPPPPPPPPPPGDRTKVAAVVDGRLQ